MLTYNVSKHAMNQNFLYINKTSMLSHWQWEFQLLYFIKMWPTTRKPTIC